MNAAKFWIKKHFWLSAVLTLGVLGLIVWFSWPHHKEASNPYEIYQRETPWPVGWRIFWLIFFYLLGFAVGAFFSPLLREFRKIIFMIVAAIVVLFAVFGPFPVADGVGAFVAIVLFLIAFAIGIRLGYKALQAAAKKRPTSFGSAQWASYEYLLTTTLFKGRGYLLGKLADPQHSETLHYGGDRHLLTVAPTRSGKGVSSIIPNLLLYPGSALVIDPKGENALATATRRGAGNDEIPGLGQKVILLDPWNIAASKLELPMGRFNPLDWITADDPDAAENAFLLADALVPENPEAADPFWDEEAKALLTGIILYVAITEEEAPKKHLGRVRDILTLDAATLKEILDKMMLHPHPVVSSAGARTSAKEIKLKSSVLAAAQSHTHFLDSLRIRDSLVTSDFKFEDLKSQPTTIYLILPADRLQTFNRWMRLLIQQAIMVNARNITKKPEFPILFLLDEMPTLGRLPSLEQAYGLMAGFGMQLWGIVQDLSQLARVYGENGWQTFISNSGVIQYFGSRDKMTAEYFSSLCGVTTIEVHNFSWAVGKAISYATSWASQGGSSSSTTTTDNWTRTTGVNEAQRHLAYPDELMVLKGHQQIVFVENLDPIPSTKLVWYQDAQLSKLGVDLHKSAPVKNPDKPAPVKALRDKVTA